MTNRRHEGPLPPESRNRKLEEIVDRADRLRSDPDEPEKYPGKYKSLYDAASAGSMSGGSLGRVQKGANTSDPTSNAALSPGEAALRSGAEFASKCISEAARLLRQAEAVHARLLEQRKGFERPRKPRWNPWAELPCGCKREETADSLPPRWIVTQRCTDHVALIPEVDRVPFLEIPGFGHEFGPFEPKAVGPAA